MPSKQRELDCSHRQDDQQDEGNFKPFERHTRLKFADRNLWQINTIDVTPSTASFVPPGSVPGLKRMTVAGELINPALVPLWVDRLELMNACKLSAFDANIN